MSKDIGAPSRLKARRQALGLTLRDVERITKFRVSNSYLSQLEKGKIKSPSLHIAAELSEVYDLPVDTLVEWLAPELDLPPICEACGQRIPRLGKAVRG